MVPPAPLAAELFAGKIRAGAERCRAYLPSLLGKRVGVVVNQASLVSGAHLIDTLLALQVNVTTIFAPEHGFRGRAADGELVDDEIDGHSGLPIVSLYGRSKQLQPEQLADLDVVVFDLQDVGVRFYSYLSTLHYVMRACALADKQLFVLDRPNPNGHYVDGPVLEGSYRSFVGMHPVPLVYGMTIGEYARMINGEGWLGDELECPLAVIPCAGYDHRSFYRLPVKPSPNLPNMRAIYLYPSLALFEGTVVSVGRGTDRQFQVYGAPGFDAGEYRFVPQPNEGSTHPPQQGRECVGFDLSKLPIDRLQDRTRLELSYLLDFYREYPDPARFFREDGYFDLLAGTGTLRRQIEHGFDEEMIRASWEADLVDFLEIRRQYLLYLDFLPSSDLH